MNDKTKFWEYSLIHPILGYRHKPDPPVKTDFHKQRDAEVSERRHQRYKAIK